MKKISVLGATGSIGKQTLDIIEKSGGEFICTAMCCEHDAASLADYANKFKPSLVAISDTTKYKALKDALNYSPEIISGDNAGELCASFYDCDTVVNGISGMKGFLPLVSAIEAKKTIAAANKESIVCGHRLLDKYKSSPDCSLTEPFINGSRIIPVDSEQSAIFQCLEHSQANESIILTASGGAFRNLTKQQLDNVTLKDALSHPTWSMGKKITIDSASLFNKGLEIMEASFLFGFDGEHIEVLIHPQSIVHSAVRFKDGSVKAQLSVPDMRTAIQYALTYPNRQKCPSDRLDLTLQNLTFEKPDTDKYPSVLLAYAALKEANVLPIVYNAANEAAVDCFMLGKCKFTDIAKIVAYAMNKADTHANTDCVCDIMEIDRLARVYALEWLK